MIFENHRIECANIGIYKAQTLWIYDYTNEKPWVCWIACNNLYFSLLFVEYLGKSSRLKQVCATGKYFSSKVGWMMICKQIKIKVICIRNILLPK